MTVTQWRCRCGSCSYCCHTDRNKDNSSIGLYTERGGTGQSQELTGNKKTQVVELGGFVVMPILRDEERQVNDGQDKSEENIWKIRAKSF